MRTRIEMATLCFSNSVASFASYQASMLSLPRLSARVELAAPRGAVKPVDTGSAQDTAHLVTVVGASGNNGKAVAEALLRAGARVRVVARRAEPLAPLVAMGADLYVGDLTDPHFLTDAFRDADAAFAMIPQHFDVPDYESDQRLMVESTTEALVRTDISHVVALSTPAAQTRVGLPAILAEFEERLKAMPGLSAIVLQPMFYMENHLASVPMIKSTGITGGAIGGSVPIPMIATRDVARVAVEYLLDLSFEGYAERQLLGPRDYTFREACAIIGAAVGIADLPYLEFTYDDARLGLIGGGFSYSSAEAFVEMARAVNDGMIRVEPRSPSNTTPTTLDEFARDMFVPAFFAA